MLFIEIVINYITCNLFWHHIFNRFILVNSFADKSGGDVDRDAVDALGAEEHLVDDLVEFVAARIERRGQILAEQAVAAKDWPGPGDSTHYLCGYVVRELVEGEWVCPEEEL